MRRIEDDEYFFICFDNVIKNPSAFILHQLANNELYKDYKNFINLENFEGRSLNDVIDLHNVIHTKNPLYRLSKSKFDYDLTYAELYLSMNNIYEDSPLLRIGEALKILLLQKFTRNVYIYSREYDERINKEIISNYNGSKKIVYVNGEFIDVVKSINKITTFIVDDIDYIEELIDNDIISYKTILLANYGYNYKLSDIVIDEEYGNELTLKIDDLSNLMYKKIFKLSTFTPNDNLE